MAVIIGEDELKAGTVSVKDLGAGLQARSGIQDHQAFKQAGKAGQVTIPRGELIATVKALL